MVDIGITQPIVVALPSQGGQGSQAGVPVKASEVLPTGGNQGEVVFSAQTAEQKRVETVEALSQQVANDFVLGDTSFTIFKDATGQYVTRFTSLRDGKVTYYPEPILYKRGNSGSSTSPSLLKINA